MNDWLRLTDALRETMKAHAPGWTDSNDWDPGVTMLEMLAFLAEGLLIYRRAVVPGGASAASRVVGALDAYVEPDPIAVRVNGTPWRRVDSLGDAGPDETVYALDVQTGTIRFGDGAHGRVPPSDGVVTARYRRATDHSASIAVRTTWPPRHGVHHVTLRDDGTMQLEAGVTLHEHLQSLHGSGIVSGLHVTVGTDGETLTVDPGLAIDPLGRELCVGKPFALAVPSPTASPSLVVLEYAERLVDPVSVSMGGGSEPTRIEEGCRLIVGQSGGGGVALARIVRDQGAWKIDTSFDPQGIAAST